MGKTIFLFLAALLLWVQPPPALAIYNNCSAPLPITLTVPDQPVLSNLPLGQTIAGTNVSFDFNITCSNWTFGGSDQWFMNPGSVGTTAYSNVYTFGAMASAGIGFRILNASGTPMAYQSGKGFPIGPATLTSSFRGSFELVRTGTTAALSNQTLNFTIHVPGAQYANAGGASGQSQINITYKLSRPKVPTCSASATGPTEVTLPTVSTAAFRGVGTSAGGVAFAVGLQCEANVNAQLTFSDINRPNNNGDSLSLASSSSALGVAVQMLSQGQPIRLSLAGPSGGTVLPVTTSASIQQVSIPLVAQYVQAASDVGPGTVLAGTVFTLTYP